MTNATNASDVAMLTWDDNGDLVILGPGFVWPGLIDPDSVRLVESELLGIRLLIPRSLIHDREAILAALDAIRRATDGPLTF